jgi:hypothetical protein
MRLLGLRAVELRRKKIEASFKISLERRSSLTSRSSSAMRARSLVGTPGRWALVDFGLAHPVPKGLGRYAELAGYAADHPVTLAGGLDLEDHPGRPFPQLSRVAAL